MDKEQLRMLEYITWCTTSLIVIATIVIWLYIRYNKENNELIKKRRWIENLPSLISTLGVIGTFAGITVGLMNFDTGDLDNSIPLLLEGLKTAFFTSLAGMIGSLILTRQVSAVFDQKDGGVSDINMAAGQIVNAVEDLSRNKITQMVDLIRQQSNNQIAYYNSTLSLIQKMDENIEHLASNTANISLAITALGVEAAAIKGNQASLEGKAESILLSVGNMEETERHLLEKTSEQAGYVGEMINHTEAIVSGQEEISNHVSKFGDKLHAEVVEIEDKMSETSNLLKEKFDEFAELLKKSNTEALVEVMKKVTEEFQNQMNALINKLIQENFEQLNTSVERLNTWQKENKEMIQSLTSQYKQMAENFEDTSTVLTKVGTDTQNLVSDGGKLEQLIDSLNEVIIKDEKFKEISTNLQQTVDLSKSNMESFDQSTRQLNEWVKKQRNFSDAVAVLIQKLEELNEMRSYASTFWKETKDGMNDAVGIVRNGSEELNRQITGLDQQFYARLNTTLANLDACIQSLITNANNNR